MNIQIQGFPHAQYDQKERFGFLAYYYPPDSYKNGPLTYFQWKRQSFSSEILNFKVGHIVDIQFFVQPFKDVINQILQLNGWTGAILIPCPSSVAKDDPNYKTHPGDKWASPQVNRDDRNIIFCKQICQNQSNIKFIDLIFRVKTKRPKNRWSATEHRKSIQLNQSLENRITQTHPFILFDDVSTSGGTMEGCEMLLMETFQNTQLIKLVLGKTMHPDQFYSISQ